MTALRRLLLLTSVLALLIPTMLPDRGRVSASAGTCQCMVTAQGYSYPGNYVDFRTANNSYFNVPNNWTCAGNYCQPLAWTTGSAVCDMHNLNNGVGYVVLDWYFSFTGSPTDYGHLNQQYDCDDLN